MSSENTISQLSVLYNSIIKTEKLIDKIVNDFLGENIILLKFLIFYMFINQKRIYKKVLNVIYFKFPDEPRVEN